MPEFEARNQYVHAHSPTDQSAQKYSPASQTYAPARLYPRPGKTDLANWVVSDALSKNSVWWDRPAALMTGLHFQVRGWHSPHHIAPLTSSSPIHNVPTPPHALTCPLYFLERGGGARWRYKDKSADGGRRCITGRLTYDPGTTKVATPRHSHAQTCAVCCRLLSHPPYACVCIWVGVTVV